ncbi:MAG: ADP-ribosylglycohydrolase family protein [Desulfobacteraceae bacterium]|nr:ADP-ribosylglycohydrolase family protein [Desulfobacteraceae bacterium]
MKQHANAMLMASFAADALSLGAHWIYDTNEIKEKFNRVDGYFQPLPESYHQTKVKGDFTHYGDQTLLLLEALSETSSFELDRFSRMWRSRMADYTGYKDHATKTTLSNLSDGASAETAGSASTDLGGASRIAPLAYLYCNSLNELVGSSRQQSAMTHNDPMVVEAAEFFARLVYLVLHGEAPKNAADKAVSDMGQPAALIKGIEKALSSVPDNTIDTIGRFGQSCGIPAAFPSVMHLIFKFEMDLKTALVENVMAGGDSAARGMLAGMVLGAHHGDDALPAHWLSEMSHLSTIRTLTGKINIQP